MACHLFLMLYLYDRKCRLLNNNNHCNYTMGYNFDLDIIIFLSAEITLPNSPYGQEIDHLENKCLRIGSLS